MPSASGNTAIAENHKHPVLLLTHDDSLWERWRTLDSLGWLPARARTFNELDNWQSAGRNLAVLDLALPKLPKMEDQQWGKITRELSLIGASSHPTETEASTLIARGFTGYLHAYSPVPVLGSALNTIALGGVWLGRQLMSRMLRELDTRLPGKAQWTESLTSREQEVAERAARGESNQEIADALGITERTVRAHVSSVFEKLGVNDRLKLALKVHGIE